MYYNFIFFIVIFLILKSRLFFQSLSFSIARKQKDISILRGIIYLFLYA